MSLSYGITFLCNCCRKLIIHWKVLYDIFLLKTCKVVLDKKRATYIKMNIEGSEIPALKGAKYTISKYHPRLAIMGYHKTSDLWEVPSLMKEYFGDYQLRLRSYMRNVAFTYYAF